MGRELDENHLHVPLPLFNNRVICATCHNPHMLEIGSNRLRATVRATELCTGCHKA
jgi:predicted CXXCH cytochrome family protein